MNKYHESALLIQTKKKILFDTCVLLYLFNPFGTNRKERERKKIKKYANLYNDIVKKNLSCCVHLVTISEFINRLLRFKYGNRQREGFKKFRDSSEGQKAQEEIYSFVKSTILKHFEVIDIEITKDKLESILILDTLDFTDKVLSLACKERDLMLFTDDKDFYSANIEILTANSHYSNFKVR